MNRPTGACTCGRGKVLCSLPVGGEAGQRVVMRSPCCGRRPRPPRYGLLFLSIASSETNHPRSAQVGHHSSTDPAEVNCQKKIQALGNQRKEAPASTPQSTLEDIAAQLRIERQNLDGLRTQKWNHKFLQATGAAQPQDQDPKTPNRSMWDYLKRYKNDHVQSSLPKEFNENASSPPHLEAGPSFPKPSGLSLVSFRP